MAERVEWVSLPVEGVALTAFTFVGNPKDGEVRLETEANPLVIVPTREFEVTFDTSASFRMSLRGLDDANFEQRILWPDGHRAVLVRAEVAWWLSREEWLEALASWSERGPWELSAVVDLRVRIR